MSFGIFFSLFGWFLFRAYGVVAPYRDAGDFAASLSTLGVPHPPGYPVYSLVGHAWLTLIPWGNPMYRLNVLSAFCAGLFGVFAQRLLQRLLARAGVDDRVASSLATVGAVGAALAPSMQSLAGVSEMYALSAALAAVVLALISFSGQSLFLLGSLIFGMGLGAHPTLLGLLPLLIATAWSKGVGRARALTRLVGATGLGLGVYLYLPLRAHQDPVQNWGNPVTWRYFWRMVTRADYGGLKLHPEQSELAWTPQSVFLQLGHFGKTMVSEWGWLGVIAAVVGWLFFMRNTAWSRVERLGWLITGVILGPGFFVLANLPLREATTMPILEPYLLVVNLFFAVGIVFALQQFVQKVPSSGRMVIVSAMTVAVALWMGGREWRKPSPRYDFTAYDYGRNLLRSLPPEAILYEPDDPTSFTLRTLQLVEHRRDDVVLFNFFRTRWGYEQLRKRHPEIFPIPFRSADELLSYFWGSVIKTRAVYGELPQKFPAGVDYTVEGVAYRAAARQSPEALVSWQDRIVRRTPRTTREAREFFGQHVTSYYGAAASNLGLAFANAGQLDQADYWYQCALVRDPDLSAAWNNRGILAHNRRAMAQAEAFYRKALSLKPDDPLILKNIELVTAR